MTTAPATTADGSLAAAPSCAHCGEPLEQPEVYVYPATGVEEPCHRRCMPPVFFINAYAVRRVCGGREEGGWWFDAGRPLASVPVPYDFEGTPTERAARMRRRVEEEKTKLRALLGWESHPDRHSVLGGEDFEVYCEDELAAPFPAEPLRYD